MNSATSPSWLSSPTRIRPGSSTRWGWDQAAAARAKNFFQRARVRYLEVSSDTRLIHTPSGTGHNYPYETPGFVVEVVRGVLAELRAGG